MKTITEFLVKKHQKAFSMQYIDLGLPSKTKWASCNLGAKQIEEVGDYFSWGETEPKEQEHFTADDYKLQNGHRFSKYNHDDKLKVLDNEDDAAFVITKGKAVMPTTEQIYELIDGTESSWTDDYNGVSGFILKSKKNKNQIFFPCNNHYKDKTQYNAAGNIPSSFACWGKERDGAPSWGVTICGQYRSGDKYSRESIRVRRDSDTYLREDGLPIRPVKK